MAIVLGKVNFLLSYPSNHANVAIVPRPQLFSNSFLRDLDKIWALREYIPDPTKPTYSKR